MDNPQYVIYIVIAGNQYYPWMMDGDWQYCGPDAKAAKNVFGRHRHSDFRCIVGIKADGTRQLIESDYPS